MPVSDIVIKGAREHNLRDVDLTLPRNQLICLTGVSGSGKSSLAFDTVYAEGQRRYVESLSSFARQFLGQMPKPDVDLISGLSPSISISQKSSGSNPRSTVGTITEILDYLRVLYARVGQGFCPRCGNPITAQTVDQIVARILQEEPGSRVAILAPLIRQQKGAHQDLLEDLLKQGYVRVRIDGTLHHLGDPVDLDRRLRHDIEVVIDRLTIAPATRGRLAESVEAAVKLGEGNLVIAVEQAEPEKAVDPSAASTGKRRRRGGPQKGDRVFSLDYACSPCGISFQPPTPQLFSFNSPQGMCQECDGLGNLYSFDPRLLIPDPGRSFKKGCVEILGSWSDLGRWRRHIYQGVADTVERLRDLPAGTLLETPWNQLDPDLQDLLLYGTGDLHVTFTWRGGQSPMKYGGQFEGIIPELNGRYRNARSAPKRRQLESFMDTIRCGSCGGQRLNRQARHIRLRSASAREQPANGLTLPQVCQLSIRQAREFFEELELNETGTLIAGQLLKEIRNRLGFLLNVGLDYLALDRTAPTLSGGESQRIRLASQIGSGLVGVVYILDEPSIGLHARDNDRLIDTLKRLRDQGNTVLVVEHDEDTMRAADRIVDFGPGPGLHGGQVVAEGEPAALLGNPQVAKHSTTIQYLSGQQEIPLPETRRPVDVQRQLTVHGARHNNLKDVEVSIPLGTLTCITGVSGSGKSSLVNDILVEALRRDLNRGLGEPGDHDRISGIDLLDKLIAIDQTPIGRTPRSNPGTYVKVFDEIRKLFAQLPDAKRRGFKPGRFSFNVKSGRCEACDGNGSNRLEMDFLADVWVTCPVCQGKRFDRETLQVKFRDHSIADVLELDVRSGLELFANIPKVHDRLKTLQDVGLDYLKIGQPSPTLSGGEAQRIKLARELSKRSTGKTLYLLDEPTTGLHFADIRMLLSVLQDFVQAGNTVLVVEHNMDVIKCADWIIDLGPEGGAGGGRIVAAGTPEQIAAHPDSFTGQALARTITGRTAAARSPDPGKPATRVAPRVATEITVRGAGQHNLRGIDVDIEREKMTVFCGPSGSGKSSLAMDTVYAEGQRRYVESLSSYARQFVNQMQKPRVENIDGLSPAIAIEQKNFGNTPRSTVGTVTEIHDYLRILYSRLGIPHCPECAERVGTQTVDQIVDKVMDHATGTRLMITAPVAPEGTRTWQTLLEEMRAAGYVRIRLNDKTVSLDEMPAIDRRSLHHVAVVVDRIVVRPQSRSRIADSVESALALGQGVIDVVYPDDRQDESRWPVRRHSQHLACARCARSFDRLSPHNFSFNSQLGWCPECEGLGTQMGASPESLMNGSHLSLRQGAVNLWPATRGPLALAMLESLHRETGLPIDVPFEELDARARRLVYYGAGDRWFSAELPGGSEGTRNRSTAGPRFRFQYQGLYPALAAASRLSSRLRGQLQSLVDTVECGVCGGSRLRDDASAVRFQDKTMDALGRMPLAKLLQEVDDWKLDPRQQKIAGEAIREIGNRVRFLCDVGLDYLTLLRGATTLSNGEAQRIRLAGQLGSGLCGVLYVLDEPTIGLHPRDNQRLLRAMHHLRDLGNTLLVVEHDRTVIEGSDDVCDFGPGSGALGGEIVAHATPARLPRKRGSVTGPWISGKKAIPVPSNRRPAFARGKGRSKSRSAEALPLEVIGARQHNLKNIDVRFPLGTLTAVTGPSGCGKSSLVNEILYNALASRLHRATATPGAHDEIRGLQYIDKVIRVDQQPLGNTPTSNPATYTGAFDLIRELYAQLPDSKLRGFSQRRFSFNVPGGRCEQCAGNGQICIEMHFLPDVWVTCQACQGKRYNEETLAVRYHGQSINDVLEMTCGDAVGLFANIPRIARILRTLCDTGLDYLRLGQSAPTLSGGEAQRVKLSAELARPDTGNTLYLLDEPTTGLHFEDLARLLDVLHRLVDLGNTVVLIEHNLDVIKSADWVIDLGPEAGNEGGQVVVAGTPEDVAGHARKVATAKRKSAKRLPSHTGSALIEVLEAGPLRKRKEFDPSAGQEPEGSMDIAEVGAGIRMPWEAAGRTWHTRTRVGNNGKEIKWDGRILEFIVDRIEAREGFGETNWNHRTVVEIPAPRKTDGWFFHALTGETWLVKLKFRCRRGTFKRDDLQQRFPFPTANEMEDLPIYGNEPRVKVTSRRGPWQEIEMRIHSLAEIDTTEFREFLDQAMDGFLEKQKRVALKLEDHTPWSRLGRKWHFMKKGFPPGKRVQWDMDVLEELHEALQRAAPGGQFLWSNKQIVHLFVPDRKEPWATIQTKKCDAVWLQLNGPSGRVPLGRVADIGNNPVVKPLDENRDMIRMSFKSVEEVQSGEFEAFLLEHLGHLSA